ncbi:TIGR02436 family protein [Capnocytophaga sp. oral taxon 863 str. F0517]|uniref:four helix bundle protein n=1 Tax=Capnocytophaga sp. oral taxon 863 TaxID=1227265 RepID=UPI0003962B8E|nr:four helix bundle protein [Capnocytophaga sp. oral taxon 863]ERI63746.1 TIGR02436 family protein [Capnocytophaga sp. oral taxon 863 str. F0517]
MIINNDRKGTLLTKSYNFAVRIVKLSKFLRENNEYILSNQVLRSGTAIGALVREGTYAQSTADFISKLSIALKEANETDYWISLLYDTNYLDKKIKDSFEKECNELIAILIASIKTTKKHLSENKENKKEK